MWDQRLIRLALLQHLRAAYGIKVKGGRGQCDRRKRETAAAEIGSKIFGVPFSALPNSLVPQYGHIPSFLVEACSSLEEHIHTEGLFRKSGSVIRLKALKNKLDNGEGGLSSALPCDIAGLLKQFFRELPEPILPAYLHEALFKAQQLGSEEKNTATLLLSCLMADRTVDILRYFFNFLRNVSLRSSKNKMDSSNLAVIFAPNLLQTSEGREKMSANTEKKLRLQAAVVQTFIDYASDIGRIPDFILEKIPAMLGIDGLCATPSLEGFEEGEQETPSECKRKRRQSVGDFVNGALNKLKSNRTPSVTPQQDGAVHCDTSPEGSSQSSLSPVTISGNHLINAGVLRRSKRIAGKKVCRVESGKAGCFSPKIGRKEKVRRSLRLKFSLGKNKDINGCPGVSRCVGRRLANQESLKNRIESVKAGLLFSPDIDERLSKKGSVKISQSEENLVTPERVDGHYRMSWTGLSNSSFQEMEASEASPRMGNLEVQNFSLEPEVTVEKSPSVSCELTPSTSHSKTKSRVAESSLSGDESNLTSQTLVKIQKAFSESGNNLHALISHRQSPAINVEKEEINESSYGEYKSEEKLFETNNLTVRESEENYKDCSIKDECCFSERDLSPHQTPSLGRESTTKCYSTQMKVELHKDTDSDVQKGSLVQQELPIAEQTREEQSPKDKLNTQAEEHENRFEENLVKCTAPEEGETKSPSCQQSMYKATNLSKPRPVRIAKQQSLVETCSKTVSEGVHVTEHGKVSDHIQWFNQLSLNESNRAKAKSPLKFHRTPVRQSVRRINSLLEYSRQPVRQKLTYLGDAASPLIKSVSCDSALPSCTDSALKESSLSCARLGPREQKSLKMKRHPDSVNASLGPAKVCTQELVSDGHVKGPLEDLTNHDILTSAVKSDASFSSGMKTTVLRKPSERERAWYKGSPKYPIAKAQLLPTSKPIDL
ncbi:rho GTPase-activating protein 11A isoform X2 [Octodon degus]|uniref:Rho GTPase-activating protein 11A n=1 Tax=Octodon degus TaxID=10160 RepID=A0A6P6DFW8_OCTDE|nr:rho GTPase-activating protein 11A isoform X2 [Octodon degus]